MTRILLILSTAFALTACSGVFESKLVAPQAYVLRLPPATASAAAANAGSVQLQRPEAGPGSTPIESHCYAATSVSISMPPADGPHRPRSHRSVMLDALRATGSFSAVFDDAAPFAPSYTLRCGLRRFEADYTSGGRAPTVHVASIARSAGAAIRAACQLHGARIVGSLRIVSTRW
jgi:ABC-type uncharacterized transport system auxiliary subunit